MVPLNQFPAVSVNVGHAFRQSPARQSDERAARVVEVALVVVAFRAVKFWRVVEPVTRRLFNCESDAIV